MRLTTIKHHKAEQACLYMPEGCIPLDSLNHRFGQKWPVDFLELLKSGKIASLRSWYESYIDAIRDESNALTIVEGKVQFAPLYRHPRKIWGIGLNYQEHADELNETTPKGEPGSFMKPDTTIIGPDEAIQIPLQSEKTTAEGELGIIIGKTCKDVPLEDWLSVVAGFTTIIDMTAEDILRRNTRYLTLSKSFDTFFSFGPTLVTPDEIDDVMKLNVATVINGHVHARNVVSNMNFRPDFLVSFHSSVMTLLPGDIISTGTPGAVYIHDGDIVECRIDGFPSLVNPVVDLKVI